jgi:hypothetical protein
MSIKEQGLAVESYEHDNQSLVSIKGRDVLYKVSYYQVVTNDCYE